VNFEYTDNVVENLVSFLSEERLQKYVEKLGADREACLELYIYNTAASEALYTPLQGVEVAVRNAIDTQLVKCHGENWHKRAERIFCYPQTEIIEKADSSLKKQKANVTRGCVVAELNFGFWVGVLAPRYEAPYGDSACAMPSPIGHARISVRMSMALSTPSDAYGTESCTMSPSYIAILSRTTRPYCE
jgi:hypothetical protein